MSTAKEQALEQALAQCRREADRYRLLAEQSTDMISRHTPTPEWTYVDVSPAVEKLLGYRVEEMIGTPGYDLFHPDDADNLVKRTESVSYRGGLYTNLFRYRHKEGHYVWLETTSRTIRDDSGEPLEIICVSRDVTAREQALRATRRLARVVEACSDMVMFCSADSQQLTYLNEAASTTLGTHQNGPVSFHLQQLFSDGIYRSLLQAALDHAAQHGTWYGSIPMQLPPAAGARIAEIREIIAHRNHAGNRRVEYYSIIGRDITLKRQAEEAARRQQLEMAHMSRLLSVGEMATGLAHEVNQPLAAILNYCRGTLRRFEEDRNPGLEQVLRTMELITGQARRAAEIVKRMRSFVRRTEYQRIVFSINDSCREVAGFLHQEASDNDIGFDFDLDPSDPPLCADRIQIEQVLLNLLRNAIEAYADCECPRRAVNIGSRHRDGYIEVTVRDYGGGVDAQRLSRLFDAFYTSKPSGLGMGLAISRTIVESHGGQLWADSDGRSGTLFQFRLPARRPGDRLDTPRLQDQDDR
ncbi:PAS domain-containing sensor histidine kinase [Marinobacterium aestuariivivens]|uniref:histidine kinase n=1 Tax=Marinobacterium aestuariivivens TaxID=1698799 RepID=A0ABW2A4E8_9GAMM